MATIAETANYIRSKNAGPFWVTIDLFFNDSEKYGIAKESKNLNKAAISELYHTKEEEVKLFFLDNLNVIKISYPRETPQGGLYERDMHSGQQYVQILGLEL